MSTGKRGPAQQLADQLNRRTRAGHCKQDKCDVYVGRGSLWGNPFVARGGGVRSKYSVTEVDDPIGEYEKYIRSAPKLMDKLYELHGKKLGCFCVRLHDAQPPPGKERCHAQVLVRLVEEVCGV